MQRRVFLIELLPIFVSIFKYVAIKLLAKCKGRPGTVIYLASWLINLQIRTTVAFYSSSSLSLINLLKISLKFNYKFLH